MKSMFKFAGAVSALFAGTAGPAFANFAVPEPGSLALVGIAIAGLVLVARKGKK